MTAISLDLRRRLVRAYRSGLTASYQVTAQMFGVGRASVSRLLRRDRETGDVLPSKRGKHRHRCVDLLWLEQHAQSLPDARLVDRIEAWEQHSGRRVSVGTMGNALDAIGWTHKKRHQSPSSATGRKCRRSDRSSSSAKAGSRSLG
jgi:transposase